MDAVIVEHFAIDRAAATVDQLDDNTEELLAFVAWANAQVDRNLAARTDPGDEKNFDRDEVACRFRWGFLYTQVRVIQAHKLVSQLPGTLAALEAGSISPDHARAIIEACGPLNAALSAEVEKRVLPNAPEQTVTNLRRSLARAVKAVDRRGWDERHAQAVKERDVAVTPRDDGMSQL